MNNQFETPILFLIFNRPDTTQQVFNRIREIKPKYLFVAADGPRHTRPAEDKICQETRDIIKKIDWNCEVKTLFRENNLGCGKAVSNAITWFFYQVEQGIILEDDCLPDLSFFPYCEELLKKYEHNDQVMLIGGNNFQDGILRGEASYYFSQYPHIWGWASWRRAWKNYEFKIDDLKEIIINKKLDHVFQTRMEKKYWEKILFKTLKKQINTWDYQWAYAIWKNRGISITPNVNLVVNLGLNNNSSHTFLIDSFKYNLRNNNIVFPMKHPPINIKFEADKFEFNNIYSHSIKRLFRLFKENRFFGIINYLKLKQNKIL